MRKRPPLGPYSRAQGLMVVLGGGAFAYARGTPVRRDFRPAGSVTLQGLLANKDTHRPRVLR